MQRAQAAQHSKEMEGLASMSQAEFNAHVAQLGPQQQRIMIDQAAPCRVDEKGSGFHQGKSLLVEQVVGMLMVREMQRHEVAIG